MMPPTPKTPCVSSIRLAAVPTAPGLARAFVRHTMQSWGQQQLIDSAELIASELVTNSVKATGKPDGVLRYTDLHDLALIGVELHLDDGAVRIAVQDCSGEQPARQTVGDDAEGGRGLFLVEALSVRWDVFPVATGKVTWAELALMPAGQHHRTAPGLAS